MNRQLVKVTLQINGFFLLKKRKNHFESSKNATKVAHLSEVLSESTCVSGTQLYPSVLGKVDVSSGKDGEGQGVSTTPQEDMGDLWGPGGFLFIYSFVVP